MKKLTYKTLYIAWAAMFLLTAVLGLAFPAVEAGALRWVLMAVSVLFFLPPWLVVAKAKAEAHPWHLRMVRTLGILSVVLTLLMLCLNLRSVGLGEFAGMALNAALTVISAPLVCSNFFALPLFLWGMLIMGTFGKK